MTVIAKVLVESKDAENANTTQYTATGVRAIIDKFTACNHTGGALTLSVNASTGAGAASANLIVQTKTLAAGETYTFPEMVGQIVSAGNSISTIASAANSISIRMCGREVS